VRGGLAQRMSPFLRVCNCTAGGGRCMRGSLRLYRRLRIEGRPQSVLLAHLIFGVNRFSPMSANHSQNAERVVSRDLEVLGGKLVFAGTRVPVQTLIDYLKAGETLDRFLDGFPTVEREQAEAYLEMTLKDAEAHA